MSKIVTKSRVFAEGYEVTETLEGIFFFAWVPDGERWRKAI